MIAYQSTNSLKQKIAKFERTYNETLNYTDETIIDDFIKALEKKAKWLYYNDKISLSTYYEININGKQVVNFFGYTFYFSKANKQKYIKYHVSRETMKGGD